MAPSEKHGLNTQKRHAYKSHIYIPQWAEGKRCLGQETSNRRRVNERRETNDTYIATMCSMSNNTWQHYTARVSLK